MIQRFVVISTQRSGTVFFETVLNKPPAIHCYAEALQQGGWMLDFSIYQYWLKRIEEDHENITYGKSQEVFLR